jgi:hypothetical protein
MLLELCTLQRWGISKMGKSGSERVWRACGLTGAVLIGMATFILGSGLGLLAFAKANAIPGTNVIVHPKFGGEVLGYDVDRDGTEG